MNNTGGFGYIGKEKWPRAVGRFFGILRWSLCGLNNSLKFDEDGVCRFRTAS